MIASMDKFLEDVQATERRLGTAGLTQAGAMEHLTGMRCTCGEYVISELDVILAQVKQNAKALAQAKIRLKRERALWFFACWLLVLLVVILLSTGSWK